MAPRRAAERGGGWGLQLMRALMDEVSVEHASGGTTVRLRRRITAEADAGPVSTPESTDE